MLRIDNLKLPVGADEKALRAACERGGNFLRAAPAPLDRCARGREARLLLRGRGQKRNGGLEALQE